MIWCFRHFTHIMLGRPWQYDRSVKWGGRKNICMICKDGVRLLLIPMTPNEVYERHEKEREKGERRRNKEKPE